MTTGELTKHGQKFSQTFKKGYGLWKDDFDSMALKTVLKLLLSKYAPLSVEMQKAVIADQAEVVDYESGEIQYIDNPEPTQEEKFEDAKIVVDEKKEELKAKAGTQATMEMP